MINSIGVCYIENRNDRPWKVFFMRVHHGDDGIDEQRFFHYYNFYHYSAFDIPVITIDRLSMFEKK